MTFSIDDFKSKGLKHGGARSNLFEVNLTFPFSTNIDSSFTAKSSFLPASITTSMNINYLGRSFKFAGERTYPQWTVTFINDQDFKLRNALEKWVDHVSGFKKIGQTKSDKYQQDANIYQLGMNGKKIKQYKFYGLYPVTLTDIAVSWDTTNAIEEFTATFDYQYYETNYEQFDPSSLTSDIESREPKSLQF
jgi:hypothetical protein